MQVLVAEENRTTARLLSGMLSDWGYDVIEANDGEATQQILQRQSPPLLSILGSGIESIEKCRALRNAHSARPSYIILVNAPGDHEGLEAGLKAGADDFINMPLSFEELYTHLMIGIRTVEVSLSLSERLRAA